MTNSLLIQRIIDIATNPSATSWLEIAFLLESKNYDITEFTVVAKEQYIKHNSILKRSQK